MKLRTGRRNPRTLYVQLGDEPSGADPCLGLVLDQHAATILCRLVNEYPDDLTWRQQVLLSAMAAQLGEQ